MPATALGLFTSAASVATIGTRSDTDTFNRADENPIAGNWSTSGTLGAKLKLLTNSVTTTDITNDAWGRFNTWVHGNDHYSQAEITAVGTNAGNGFGVTVRQNTTIGTETMYRLVMDGAGNIELASFITGTYAQLATRNVTYVAGTKLGLSVQGTTLKIWYGGVQQGASVTDANIASGSPGLAYSSSITSGSIDNWDAGTVP